MNVLIVEDETAAYENLVDILMEVAPDIQIAGNTESVTQTVHWLQSNPASELIFMDIHLSDGSAFNIFDKIELETPIVFTTAYDRYAIEAFKVNSIDYLLKPIKVEDIRHALDKYGKLNRQDILQYLSQLTRLAPAPKYKDKLLVPYKDKLLPVNLKDVSCFYTSGKNTSIYLKDGVTNDTELTGYNARYIRQLKYHFELNKTPHDKSDYPWIPNINFEHRLAQLRFSVIPASDQSKRTEPPFKT